MILQKQNIHINFAQGVDKKTDPKQVPIGKFSALDNINFQVGGLLEKRNGFANLPNLLTEAVYLTTFNGDLTAIGTLPSATGTYLQALSTSYQQFVNRGFIQPIGLSVLSLIKNNLNQIQVDTAVSSSGLVCTVYSELNNTTVSYKYAVADSVTGQNVISPTLLPNAATTYGTPRVFNLGNYFVIVYTVEIISTYHLEYIAISTSSLNITSPVSISTYTPATTVAFDGAIYDDTLYLAWNGAGGVGIEMTYMTHNLALSGITNPDAAHSATMMSVTADSINGVIWVSYYNSGTSAGYTLAVSPILAPILAPTQIITASTVLNITSSAQSGLLSVFYEVANNYSYDSSIPTHFISTRTVTQAGVVGSLSTLIRSVGLASKSFIINGVIYLLTTYQSPYQNTYFLINAAANIISILAYENGGGYLTLGLPEVTVTGNIAQVGYLYKDLIQAVNTNTNVPAGSQVDGIYSQTGINLATFNFSPSVISAEIGTNLNITGGITWAYDGYSAVEQGFFLYPDSVEVSGSGTSGSMSPQEYFYQVTYEWSDNQGNAFRSAPSIPVSVTLTSDTSVLINFPTLRLTYKTANPVKIVIYRWSQAQQVYYQVTSIIAPILNNTTIDSISYTDTSSDATILGNNLLYTNGGVLEDIGPPSFSSVFLFDDRLWGITSEDPNLLWYSKQVIEATSVEFSDLLTMYIAPNLGAQGPSGNLLCGFPMDDKCILFKMASISYFNGTGPDITGANNQYSPPFIITTTLGCSNQHSIVFMPKGLMFEFQSNSGNQIWLLARDLSTMYIGADVESYTLNATVLSSLNIPGTNQVRYTMSTGIVLMYDYYYNKWGTFSGIPALSSTLYQGLHTFINSNSQVYQESPGTYLDGSNPVLMSFTTGWINIAGIQGYLRAYWFFLLGQYLSPHKLMMTIAYDYNPAPAQGTLISPTNFAPNYGGPQSDGQQTVYGTGTYGGPGGIENWRIFLDRHRCTAFQITLQEIYDPSFGFPPGAGLTLSGLNLVYAIKKGWRTISAANSAGGQPS